MLPRGWEEVQLGELSFKIGSGATPRGGREAYGKVGTPLIRSMNVHFEGFTYDGLAYIDDKQAQALANVEVRPNDVLLNITGASIGRVCLAPRNMSGARVNQHVCIIRSVEVLPEFIRAFLAAPEMQRFILEENYGLTRQALTKGMIEAIRVPLPPESEQRRIVAKLDALTTRLARARAELDRVPMLAARSRSAAVRAAFHGDLTADWRANRATEGLSPLPSHDLPKGWAWTTLGALAKIKSGIALGKRRPSHAELIEVPYLRVANVQRGSLNLGMIKHITVTNDEAAALYLKPGDILLNEGGDRDKLGRGWIWEGEIPNCIHQNHVFRARLFDQRNNPYFVSLYANEFGQDYFLSHGTQTTNLASISKAKLSALPVPLAPPEEQAEIVRRIQSVFARADRLEAEAARAQALLERLESTFLARAFRGELVPQDPNDEPVSVLLERIRAQRATAPKPKRGRARGSA